MYCKFGSFRESLIFAKLCIFVKSSDITLSFTDMGKSCTVRDFYVASVSFKAIRENKFLAKISEFIVNAQNSCFGDSCGCIRVKAVSNLISRYWKKNNITAAAYITTMLIKHHGNYLQSM